jgi:hypothetical protein
MELERYSLVQLTDVIAHHAVKFRVWVPPTPRKAGHYIDDVNPPKDIVEAFLGAHHYDLPDIIGVISSPTLRPDLTLITQPGYDPTTKLWYKPSDNVRLPPITERPSQQEALAGLQLLQRLLDGFPFEGEKDQPKGNRHSVSRSVALAGIMTTVARGALLGAVPLFLITAPDARTGKSYLVNLTGVIATGHVPVSTAGAEKKEEFEKRIETAALSARPIMHLNNLPNGMVVESDRLAELATEGVIDIRKLGRLEQGQCDCRATTVFLNGNNIGLTKDLVPRSLHCRLVAGVEHPEERTFDSDPIEQVLKDRGACLAAVITIIRAWAAASENESVKYKRVAGFDLWSKRIQQALIWLGEPDPWGAMAAMRGADPSEDELLRLLHALDEAFPLPAEQDKARETITVAKCQAKADDMVERNAFDRPVWRYPRLRDLMSVRGQINNEAFGKLLSRSRDRTRGGLCLKVGKVRDGALTYHLAGERQSVADERPSAADKF